MNKTYIWIAVGVVVLLAIFGFARKSGYVEQSPSPTPTPTATATPKPGGSTPSAQTYTKLVAQYAGRRIQFDQYCQASPNNVTFKTGTAVMFDNRSGDARTIKIGSTAYTFPGYGYRIITLASKSLPKTLFLSCGSAVNVGQILLQK